MPLARAEGYGEVNVGSASAVWATSLGADQDATVNCPALLVSDLPRLFFYLNWTTSGGTVSYTPQFAVDDVVTAGNVIIPNWQPLSVSTALVSGTPALVNFQIAAKWVRLVVTRSAATETVSVVFGGTQ